MGRLDSRAKEKVKGRSWDKIRDSFIKICDELLSVSKNAMGTLITVYIKFTLDENSMSPVYSVVWIKSSKKLIIGLALPNEMNDERFIPEPRGTRYAGLTKYIEVAPENEIPSEFKSWAKAAFENAKEKLKKE